MGDLRDINKIYYKVFTKGDLNDFEFSVKKVKVRNRLKDGGYSFYNEDGETVQISGKLMEGVFLQFCIEDTDEPYVESYFISDDDDIYDLISGDKPSKDEEEEKYLKELMEGMREIVNNGLTSLLEVVKEQTESIADQLEAKKEHRNGYAVTEDD